MSLVAIPNEGNITFAHLSNSTTTSSQNKSSVLHRSLHHLPLKVVNASGNYLYLANGQKVLDATGGAAVACLGHGNARVNDAATRQMQSFSYCHSLFFSSTAAEELAAELTASTGGHMTKAFIVSSGSEAMEAAMKLARQFYLEQSPPQPQRVNFIGRQESYHGNTLGALGMSGHVTRRALFEPLLSHATSRVSACNAYRGQGVNESTEQYVARLAEELDAKFAVLGPDTVCAFVAEPVVGAALGCVPSVPGYFKAMKAVCEKHGALLILDEVMCGMGRSGTMHAWEQEGVVPEIQTIGKGLGGGYAAVAGLLINRRVVEVLDKGTGAFMHGQTYQGHPVACAVALEVQRIVREEDLVANVHKMGTLLETLLKEKLGQHPNVGDIRGKGLFWGIEFVHDKASKSPFPPSQAIAMGVHEKGLEPHYSISLYPGSGSVDGRNGDHVLVAPAYNVTEAEVRLIVDLTASVINEFFTEVNSNADKGHST